MPGFVLPHRYVQSTVLAALLACPFAGASAFTFDEPPALLDYATSTLQRESSVAAWSTLVGSLRETPCSDSGAFWACRDLINASDPLAPENRVSIVSNTNSVVNATRSAFAFDYVVPTNQINYTYFSDVTPATSNARAKTDFGSNKAEASAWNSRYWTESRVESAWDPTIRSIDADTTSGAIARSLYSELLTPSADGQITLQFELKQHAGSPRTSWSGFVSDFYEGYGSGELLIQVFNLDMLYEYWRPDSSFPIDGPMLVGSSEISRLAEDGSGSSLFDVAFDVVAGNRYVLVSQLTVLAEYNASVDFYGTASLERILVSPGMTLDIGSGTGYNIAAVPEPETYAMLLAGLGMVAFMAQRRRRAF